MAAAETHVWRIPLDRSEDVTPHLETLDDHERERVRRFHFPHHGRRYAIAHAALRQILAAYASVNPRALAFSAGEHGKPEFARGGVISPDALQFNLSHSGDLALLAVSRHGPVGVDVERWRATVEHLEIAERFFSPYERDALRGAAEGCARDDDVVLRGFFSTWSRKEAYLKATGHGITRGLFHFDVTLELPDSHSAALVDPTHRTARLLADRLDPNATERWTLSALDVGPGYSGALVTARPQSGAEGAIALFESPYI